MGADWSAAGYFVGEVPFGHAGAVGVVGAGNFRCLRWRWSLNTLRFGGGGRFEWNEAGRIKIAAAGHVLLEPSADILPMRANTV